MVGVVKTMTDPSPSNTTSGSSAVRSLMNRSLLVAEARVHPVWIDVEERSVPGRA